LRRIIQNSIREPLADWLLTEGLPDGATVHIKVKGPKLEFCRGDN